MIREVKKERETPPPKKRSSPLFRALAILLTLALVLGAIFLVVNRDKLNFDALKRWFTYRSLERSDNGGAPFAYQGGGSLSLRACGGDLLCVSQTGVRLYGPGGTAYLEDTFPMDNPVCQVSGKRAVVYDAAGSTLRVYKNRAKVFDRPDADGAILSARLNEDGYLCVVARSSGYKGVISVYNADYQLLLDLKISSSYVLDAVVSPDNRSLLVLTAGQEDHFFNSTLARYSLTDLDPEDPAPAGSWSLGNRLPLDLVWDDRGVRVLTQYAALCADGSLNQTGEYSWPDRYLRSYSLLADDAFVVLTSKYRSGSQATLEVVDRGGQRLASLEESRPVLAVSAAGKYIGVLTGQELNIYTRDLTLYATIENTAEATHLAMLADGSAFLASQDTAWLCLPD